MQTTNELNLLTLLVQGGIVMIPILFLSIVACYLIIERWMSIRNKTSRNHLLLSQITDQLHNGKLQSALLLCERDNSACAQVLYTGLQNMGKPITEMEHMMESAAQIQIAEMEHKLNYLGLIAGIAPMLGFIGTISGVIRIFYNIAISDNFTISTIASGLYEKMITSGAGLVVGVLAYTGYHLLNMYMDTIVAGIQKQSFLFIQTLQRPAYEDSKK